MNHKPSFSVIVPVYGVEPYIAKFAHSLLGQTYDSIQFIFVNDGTKDASIDVLKAVIDNEYAHLKDRIIVVNKENEGLPAARKTGMEYVSGDYVLHVDSDDWLDTSLIAKLADKAVETDADIIYYDFYKEYSRYAKHDVEKEYTASDKMKFIHGLFNYKAYGYVWNKCVKRRLYLENEITFPVYGMHEDIYLMSQLLYYADSIVHLNEPLYHYRRNNPGSISAAKSVNRRRDSAMNMMDLYYRYENDLENSPIRDVVGEILFRTAWLSIRYKLGFFDRYPNLAPAIKKIRPSFANKTFILWQLYVKLYAAFL